MNYKTPFKMDGEAVDIMKKIDQRIKKHPMSFDVYIGSQFDRLINKIPYSLHHLYGFKIPITDLITGVEYYLLP